LVEVAIDTASEIGGVALTQDGALVSELTWHTRQNHSRELLPSLEWLLKRSDIPRAGIAAIFVCLGPGSYAGLRAGLSTAKGLAYALEAPIAGVGRLAADADAFAIEPGRRVVAVHAAGRAELAWAAYTRNGPALSELISPRLNSREALVGRLLPGDIVCGEIDEGLQREITVRGATWARPHLSRVVAVARLGSQRLQSGSIDSSESLVPLYLREPAIGPQPAVLP
jgi:tRNA threonylcarbamoyl adenosine modification protein YeaZ